MELTELEKFASDMEKNILKVDDLPEHKRAAYEDMKQEVITFSTKNSIKKYSKMLKELQEIFERSEVKNGLKVLDGHKGNLNDEEIERIDELGINFIEIGMVAAEVIERTKRNIHEWKEEDWKDFKKAIFTENRQLPTVYKEYDMLPSSAAFYELKKILDNGKAYMGYGKGKVTYSQTNLVTGAQNITFEGDTAHLDITISKIREIGLKQDENARKLFNYILTKANEQNKNERIFFNLSDLVERGIYKTEHSAYKGVKLFFDKLMSIQVGGTQWAGYGNNKKEIRATKKQILIEYDIHEGKTSFFEMKREIINFLCLYYSLFPKWIYSLKNNKAFALADHIYYIASQRKKEIAKDGTFKISFENIRQVLGIPDPSETQKHTEKIINPILKAIDDIEKNQNVNTTNRIFLTPQYNELYKNASDFLTGYLEIIIDDGTRKYITERQQDKDNKIKKTKQRHEKARQNAIQKVLKEKYEAGEISL